MRIVYLNNNMNLGGAETGLLHLIDQDFLHAEANEIRYVSLFRGSGELIPSMQERGVDYRYLMPQRKMTVPRLIQCHGKLRSLINEFQPHMVLLSLPQANILGRAAMRNRPGLVVTLEHNTSLPQSIYIRPLRLSSKRVDAVLYDSVAAGEANASYYTPKERYRAFLPLIAVNDGARVKTDYRLHQPVKLLSVGRLLPVKHFAGAIQALRRLKDDGMEAELTIAGDGPLRAELEALVEQLQLQGQVQLPGFVAGWTQQAHAYDLYLQVSHNEGLCISQVEAMAAGLPVISSNVGGMRDYIRAEENAFCTEDNAAEAIAETIRRAIQDDQQREAIAKRGVEEIHARFGQEAVKQQLETVYQTLRDAAGGDLS